MLDLDQWDELILLGFSCGLQVQTLLYLVFLVTYMVTITENAIIIFVCMTQLYFISLMCTECVLLAVMAYDFYLAVCRPLHYQAIMAHKLCFQLSILSWAGGFSISLVKVSFISRLTFCGPQVINHFFWDISSVLNLSCTDMSLAVTVDFVLALVILFIPLLIIVFSYCCILSTILCIPSAQGRRKAFSTCTSHFTVVIIFFSAALFMYARPRRIHPFNLNKIVSVFYAVFTPALNPLICCLSNKEVKEILRNIIGISCSL
uniref:G-protein coupled receptors family 1 profile domain-containing protein n=1 Tax=Calidris pygmaea TaxID=425635 RepID=A0A8C3JII6_9CHAR